MLPMNKTLTATVSFVKNIFRFHFTEDGTKVTSCPMGYVPDKTTYYPKTGMCRALFAKECCEGCPHKNECKGKPQKKNYAVHVSANMVARAKYIPNLSTKEYLQLTRKRNGIEGIMSVLRRKYRVDDIPTFEYLRSRQFSLFKIGAYNYKKLMNYNKRLRKKRKETGTQGTNDRRKT